MKISKVNHTRAAVGVSHENVSGMLYKTPLGDKRELKQYIKEKWRYVYTF